MYRLTSIARPIDPAYLTNRALLIVLPLVMLVSAGLASLDDMGRGPVSAALNAALVAFVGWALTRELAPDHNGAAFVALVFAWILNIAFGTSLVLLAFVAMLLVRLVNRSTGLAWQPLDTVGVLGFCIWAAAGTEQPLILIVAAVAFTLDAVLKEPLRRHYFAAAVCLLAFFWMSPGVTGLIASDLGVGDWALVGVSAAGIFLLAATSQQPVSYCDVSPDRLDRARVNAGLVIGWLLAFQALLTDGRPAWLETPVWACIVAVLLALLVHQATSRQ